MAIRLIVAGLGALRAKDLGRLMTGNLLSSISGGKPTFPT